VENEFDRAGGYDLLMILFRVYASLEYEELISIILGLFHAYRSIQSIPENTPIKKEFLNVKPGVLNSLLHSSSTLEMSFIVSVLQNVILIRLGEYMKGVKEKRDQEGLYSNSKDIYPSLYSSLLLFWVNGHDVINPKFLDINTLRLPLKTHPTISSPLSAYPVYNLTLLNYSLRALICLSLTPSNYLLLIKTYPITSLLLSLSKLLLTSSSPSLLFSSSTPSTPIIPSSHLSSYTVISSSSLTPSHFPSFTTKLTGLSAIETMISCNASILLANISTVTSSDLKGEILNEGFYNTLVKMLEGFRLHLENKPTKETDESVYLFSPYYFDVVKYL
jgi:hypothetical protein